MARKNLFSIDEADAGRPAYSPPSVQKTTPASTFIAAERGGEGKKQAYRAGKRAVMFFLSEEAFSEMHVILARQGRRKVQSLMEELIDDWFRRENAPRLNRYRRTVAQSRRPHEHMCEGAPVRRHYS